MFQRGREIQRYQTPVLPLPVGGHWMETPGTQGHPDKPRRLIHLLQRSLHPLSPPPFTWSVFREREGTVQGPPTSGRSQVGGEIKCGRSHMGEFSDV